MTCNIWNAKHYMDLTAKKAMDNVMKESHRRKGQHLDFIPKAMTKPEPESKQTVYRLAWVAPELR